MDSERFVPLQGQCACGDVEYQLQASPLFTHACHCLDCQRKSGSAFSLTCIVVEQDISVTNGQLTTRVISPRSTLHLCPGCRAGIYVTSSAFAGTAILLASSLADLRMLNIGAHIWVKRKHAWLSLPDDVPQFEEDYDRARTWPKESLSRIDAG